MPAAKLIPGPCREELLAGAGTIEEIHIHWWRCYTKQREGKKHSGFSLPPTFQTLNSASHWLDLGGQAGKGAWDLSSVGIAPPSMWYRAEQRSWNVTCCKRQQLAFNTNILFNPSQSQEVQTWLLECREVVRWTNTFKGTIYIIIFTKHGALEYALIWIQIGKF